VRAFWSGTTLTSNRLFPEVAERQLGYFYDNPINRYSLNSCMLQRGKLHTENGTLVIYVQHDEPADPNRRRNWLPAPKEGFRFAARFYSPYGPLIDGRYQMPGVVRHDP
jgi:hypothetical protein